VIVAVGAGHRARHVVQRPEQRLVKGEGLRPVVLLVRQVDAGVHRLAAAVVGVVPLGEVREACERSHSQ